MTVRILKGDCREVLRELPAESVHCVVTSPPYWGLRDYGVAGQIGLEESYGDFVSAMTDVFRDVRRVLRADGTLWLNLGDSYATGGNIGRKDTTPEALQRRAEAYGTGTGAGSLVGKGAPKPRAIDLKTKDLVGIPWRVAFALQADGWYLRQDIIWAKPNPMPESVTDRCTKAHEYLFLLSKSERYHYDAAAISEPLAVASVSRLSQPTLDQQRGSDRVPGKTNGTMKAVRGRPGGRKPEAFDAFVSGAGRSGVGEGLDMRNKRSVWEVTTVGFAEAHFATFPPALIEPCILAGCPKGGTVLDPFGGAGTTGLVADRLGRNAILIELNPAYAEMARRRIEGDSPLFAEVT